MSNQSNFDLKYLQLLSKEYPNSQSVLTEIINLTAILNLPKGTEHFISDIHGEYDAFKHIMNNCSGVIKEKIEELFGATDNEAERLNLCTLIYYPKEKLELIKNQGQNTEQWYGKILQKLTAIAKYVSSKYTRSKVRKALPKEFSYIIDELIHAKAKENDNQTEYHEKILETIIKLDNADEFIFALAALIKRLAVDHLHIVGDIYDRGAYADKVMDLLINHHSIDIEWGNHDILWMGAAAGSKICIANAIRNNLAYNNMEFLERGYGISLRALTLFAEKTYRHTNTTEAALKAIAIILFKLEGQLINRHQEFGMSNRLLLEKINFAKSEVVLDGKIYNLKSNDFTTIERDNPYVLSKEEEEIMDELVLTFQSSERLNRHIRFLYSNGSIYRCYNGNLLLHGCIPLDSKGNFASITTKDGTFKGKALLDYADATARKAYFEQSNEYLDFMWFLWCGFYSPLCGKTVKTFERTFIDDPKACEEEKNSYYYHYNNEAICNMILNEFGLFDQSSHIINGHTPILAKDGENPIKANGRLIVIDGGFCKAYQKSTGIAGYTLIYNSCSMKIKSHNPFKSIDDVLNENSDIESITHIFENAKKRVKVKDTDIGKKLNAQISDLKDLLCAYKQGISF